ncbi:lactate utilization protein [Evtepia sp.]|uniref:lactate utilization protein n=1 Tax=Evtepia sp. TaxID=2773933 RepID=UPI003F18CCBD
MNLENLQKNVEARGFSYRYFDTAAQAADYLAGSISGKTVGIGGSMTLLDMGIYERLQEDNDVAWHWKTPGPETLAKAAAAQVYLTSVNGIAETGEIINIDGTGNRVAATLYDREKVYLVAGVNKVAPTYEEALWRARNIAAPLNARRLSRKTPCALKEEMKCYDCKSPERICNGLTVLWRKLGGVKECELVLIGQELGY